MHKLLIATVAATALLARVAAAQTGQGRFAAMLAMADANHDGAITRAEFDAARAARFARLDADHNGMLSADERPRWGAGQGGDGGHHMPGDSNNDASVSRAEWDAQGARMFARLDTNNDGVISAAEIQAAQQRARGMQH